MIAGTTSPIDTSKVQVLRLVTWPWPLYNTNSLYDYMYLYKRDEAGHPFCLRVLDNLLLRSGRFILNKMLIKINVKSS